MNELITAALERSPVPEMEQKATSPSEVTVSSVSHERMETETETCSDSYTNESPPPPAKSQSREPSPRSYDDDDDDADDTRDTRTPPQAAVERRAYHDQMEQEQKQRYRSSPPPPPSLSSSAAPSAYHHQRQQQQQQHYQQNAHQQQQYQQQYPHPRHQGESTGYYDYHLTPPPLITQQQRSNTDRYRNNQLRGSPQVHPREVLPSATDSFRSGGCTCKKSRCLKLYCQCFSSSTTCGPKCKCVACHNSTLHADSIETARHTILERNPAAFDDKFQKPGTVKNVQRVGHHDHHAVYGGVDIFAPTSAAVPSSASWNSSSSRDHHGSIRYPHQHQQQHHQQQHLQQHMPYTFAQQQQQQQQHTPPQPQPPLPAASAARASAPIAPSGYTYTPPAYASSHASSGPLPFCLPHTPSPPPPPAPTNSRVNKFGCKCKRSFCLKKYCECFQNATHCGLNCKCTNCKNFPDPNLPSGGASSAPTVAVAAAAAGGTSVLVSSSRTGRADPRKSAMPTMAAAVPFATTTPVVTHTQQDGYQERPDMDEDRMAMMAAVAMAQLSGGLTSFKGEHEQTESSSLTPAPRRISNEREREWNQDHGGNKRKVEQEREGETLSSVPIKKRKPPKEHLASLADDEVRAAVSSSMSVESRNPSPVSTMRSHYYPQAGDRLSYHHSMPPQAQTGRYPPQHGHGHASHRASPVHPRDPRASPPPAYEYNRVVSTRYLQPSPPPNFRNSPPPYNRSSPPPYVRSSPPPPPGMYSNGVTPSPYKQSGSYEEVLRSSGLPKALSFRKICSKCGKTRGEHGELGFGNKCVYQECGKCGAGQHMHERAGQPMGVLCCLTTEDGATPLASAIYERKIRELAARADLQRELQRRKEEATQDIVQRCQEAEASAAAMKEAVGTDVQ